MTMTMLLLKASVLLGAGLLAARLLGRGSAAARHGLWSATFVSLLALPLLGSVTPVLSVPVPAAWRAEAPAAAAIASPAQGARHMPDEMPGPTDAAPTALRPDIRDMRSDPARRVSAAAAASVALTVWLAGTAVAVALLLLSLLRVRRLAAHSYAAGAAWNETADALGTQLGPRRRARVVFSDAVRTPMAGGVWRPLIFLPSAAAGWDVERREIVLAHELSHLARRDPLRHIAARLALACYWFHPLAWVAARQSSLAREQACDEAVLAFGIRPSDYARVLLDLAESMAWPRATAALPMVERSLLEKRVMAILDTRSHRTGSRPLVVAAGAALATLTLAAARPAVQAATTIGAPPAQPAPGLPGASAPLSPARAHFTGAVVVEAPASTPQATRADCWADTFGGSFRGNSTTVQDAGDRTVVYEMIGTRNGDRVVQTHFGDLRVCMVAEGAVGLESDKPSRWSAPRVLIETRRGGSTQQMEIRGEQQVTWRVNGAERPVDAAAREWRAAILAALDTTWELSTLRGEVSTLRGEISTIRGEESTLRGRISTLQGEVSTMRGRQSTIRGNESTLRGETSTIRGHVSTLQGRISSEQGAISTLEARGWDATAAERDGIVAHVREHQDEIARVEREIRDYDEAGRIADVERRIRALDADGKTAAIDEEIRRFDVDAKIAAVDEQIKALDVDGKTAGIERRIQALDADRRARSLEDRRDVEVKRLDKAVAAIK